MLQRKKKKKITHSEILEDYVWGHSDSERGNLGYLNAVSQYVCKMWHNREFVFLYKTEKNLLNFVLTPLYLKILKKIQQSFMNPFDNITDCKIDDFSK